MSSDWQPAPGLAEICVHGIVSSLFDISNFCGKIGALIPVHRKRIYLKSGQKAFKVASDFTQLISDHLVWEYWALGSCSLWKGGTFVMLQLSVSHSLWLPKFRF